LWHPFFTKSFKYINLWQKMVWICTFKELLRLSKSCLIWNLLWVLNKKMYRYTESLLWWQSSIVVCLYHLKHNYNNKSKISVNLNTFPMHLSDNGAISECQATYLHMSVNALLNKACENKRHNSCSVTLGGWVFLH